MKNKYIIIILTLLLASSSTYFLYKYELLRRESLTLKLKLKQAVKNKKTAISWSEFKKIDNKKTKPSLTQNTGKDIPVKKDTEIDVSDMDIEKLVSNLQSSLKMYWMLNRKELERNLVIVDELISRNPNVYSSYKAKLILLLSMENKYDEVIDEVVFEEILSTMSDFDMVSTKVLQKEAFLIARTNALIDESISRIEELEDQLEEFDESESVTGLEVELVKRLDELESLENQLEDRLLENNDFFNEDLIEILLLRSLAKEDYELVLEESEDLLNEFPNSINGHFFLIRALELNGRSEDAIEYIKNIELDQTNMDALADRLKKARELNPKNYWKRLRF